MNRQRRSWLSLGQLAQMTGFTRKWMCELATAGKIPGRCIVTFGGHHRFDDTPELRTWAAAMTTIRRAPKHTIKNFGDAGAPRKLVKRIKNSVEASKALVKFQIAYARHSPLNTWRLVDLEALEYELREMAKIHRDVCRAIQARQMKRRNDAA
jgi:hypothetical protein